MPRAASRACGTSLLGRPMRMPVAGSTTTFQPNSSCVRLGGGDQLRAFGRRQHAGDLGLVALLEILDRGQHGVVAAAHAGIVARPQQRRLDFQALVARNAGEDIGRRLCFGGGFRRGGFGGESLCGCRFGFGGLGVSGLRLGRFDVGGFRRDRLGFRGRRFRGLGNDGLSYCRLGGGRFGLDRFGGNRFVLEVLFGRLGVGLLRHWYNARRLRQHWTGAEEQHEHHQERTATHRSNAIPPYFAAP